MPEERPDPDALLRRVAAEEGKAGRGRLKVFFGAAPGVGKTYAMLQAARRKRTEGLDVVIGWVETHGRPETAALASDLETIPPKDVEYRDVRLRELDLDAALVRRPGLLLVDELAHTNAPGSRHARRWQDVQELLDGGVDVFTTLNVQHLESLNDLVNQITGITVRETLPDHVLDEADEVEFVDLPPEELLKRLAEGKVYLPDQASRAVRRFFRRGNLIALRELALRRTAERVDAEMQDYRRHHGIEKTWPVAERILVGIRPNPDSTRLIRAARRMAAQLKAKWIVAYIASPSQPTLTLSERRYLAMAMRLAEQLGGDTAFLAGTSVSAALISFAREKNVSKIVVGKPTHHRWRDRLIGSLQDEIVRASGEIDVYIISGEHEEPRAGGKAPVRERKPLRSYLSAVAVVLLCTLLAWAMFGRFDNSNLIMVYLLGVAAVATRYGRGPSVVAACLSVAAFDFFFVPPYLTFGVADTQYSVTFAVMLAVGLLISTLAVRLRRQAESARQREQRTRVLYALSRELTGLRKLEEIGRAACRHVAEVFHGPAVILLPSLDGRLVPTPQDSTVFPLDSNEMAVAEWVHKNGRMAGLGTDTLAGASALYVPLTGTQGSLGVLGVCPERRLQPLTPDQLDLLETLARQTAAAVERVRLAAERQQARLAVESERMRSTLLSSVSHDLRTPLAAITGAASSLLQDRPVAEEVQRELKETIYEEAERLNRLVTNLLNMTRLESGSLRLSREWHSLEEVVGSALGRLERAAAGKRIETDLPADLPLVPMDAVLIEQVIINLVENALKHTEPGCTVRISARRRADDSVLVQVSDDGPGVPAGAEEKVFEKFYSTDPGQRGFGLGLPICRAIVMAHGGTIWVENRSPHGAVFSFVLPGAGRAPEAPAVESMSESQPA